MKFILAIFFYTSITNASSFKECNYTIEVVTIDVKAVTATLKKTTTNDPTCLKFNEAKIIKMKNITKGKELLRLNKKLKAKRTIYNKMGHSGPISGLTWELSPLK